MYVTIYKISGYWAGGHTLKEYIMKKERISGLFRFGLAAIVVLSLVLIACPQEADSPKENGPDWPLPSGATPSVTAGHEKLILSWGAVSGADRYEIYCGEIDNPYLLSWVGHTTETRFVIDGLENGKKYNVWTRAGRFKPDFVDLDYGPFSGMASGTPVAATAAPPIPTGLRATPGQDYIKLTWDEVPGATSYGIQRMSDLTDWGVADFVVVTCSPHFDSISVLTAATTYKYRIRAINSFGNSVYSQEVTTALLDPYPLTVNTWDNREFKFSENTEILEDNTVYQRTHYYKISVPASKLYNIHWNQDAYGDGTKTAAIVVNANWKTGGTPAVWAVTSAVRNTWTISPSLDTAPSTGSARDVVVAVTAFNNTHENIGTYAIRFYDPADTTIISQIAPDPSVSGSEGLGALVSWAKNDDVDGYNVYRSASSKGPFTKINAAMVAQPAAGPVYYVDTNVTAGLTYYYQVKAATTTPAAEGPCSAPVPFTVPTTYKPPVALTTTWVNGNIAVGNTVDWYSLNVTDGEDYYIWWNDLADGDSSKTLDIDVSAYYADRTSIFVNVDSGYDTNRQDFTADRTGVVYIMTRAKGGVASTGTYGIVYSTTDTMP